MENIRDMDETVKLHTKQRYCTGRNAEVDGDIFKFKGESDAVGVVKILEPTSPMLNYYEYEIIDRGEKCAIGIGVGEKTYPLDRMPGWNAHGIGYHADDGKLFHHDDGGSAYGKPFGPTSDVGDRMGCGVDFETDVGYGYVNVFFTRNGQQVGESIKMKRPLRGLYPIVGMHSRGEKVRYLGHSRRLPYTVIPPMDLDTSPWSVWLRSNGVKFLEDGLTLEYCGEGLWGQDVGIAQANCHLDWTNHYFEMEILSAGKKGCLAIGLAKSTYPLHHHPGWDKGSIGYLADNGQLYKELEVGMPFGPTCTEGDRMGCGILFPATDDMVLSNFSESDSDIERTAEFEYEKDDEEGVLSGSDSDFSGDDWDLLKQLHVKYRALMKQKSQVKGEKRTKTKETGSVCTVYFTKNGERVGSVECSVPRGGFYPVVAMLSGGEKIRVNFEPLTG